VRALGDDIDRLCFYSTTRYFQVIQLRQEVMPGKKLPCKPKQYCQKFRQVWLHDSECTMARCLSCWFNKSLLQNLQSYQNIANLKGMLVAKNTHIRLKNCSNINNTTFKLQWPDLQRWRAEAMLSLLLAEHFSTV